MESCEWWRSNGGSRPPPLITHHMTNYNKNCEIFYDPNIALSKTWEAINVSKWKA